jgi:hypothetical protein
MMEHFTEGMGTAESEGWASEIGTSVGLAQAWQQGDWKGLKENIEGKLTTIDAGITALPASIMAES